MSSKDKTLTCRACNVAARCAFTNTEIEEAHCPTCGISVKGTDSKKMVKELASYLAMTEAQASFKRAFRGNRNIEYKSTRIRQPNWPFILKS